MAFFVKVNGKHTGRAKAEKRTVQTKSTLPRPSVVEVYFKARNMTLAYYNDRFDIQPGDWVYVEGKFAGILGYVTQVNYNFKIRLSDYKRVIALVDGTVQGTFHMFDSYAVTFDRYTLPADKVRGWFRAPEENETTVSGSDGTSFDLNDLDGMQASTAVFHRGMEYHLDGNVKYLCIDGTKGYAIVQGTEAYEVEFSYVEGTIRDLTCTCFCNYTCKHQVATMLELQDILGWIQEQHMESFAHTGYFAAVSMDGLLRFTMLGRKNGTLTFADMK